MLSPSTALCCFAFVLYKGHISFASGNYIMYLLPPTSIGICYSVYKHLCKWEISSLSLFVLNLSVISYDYHSVHWWQEHGDRLQLQASSGNWKGYPILILELTSFNSIIILHCSFAHYGSIYQQSFLLEPNQVEDNADQSNVISGIREGMLPKCPVDTLLCRLK